VIRTVGLESAQVPRYLDDLEGIITEETVIEKQGIYSWSIRHEVIFQIIADAKFHSTDEFYDLIENVIDNLNPTYTIEVMSLSDLCDMKRGLDRIAKRGKQNVLLRKMISAAPSERVPRHRLITNLIKMGDYETANTEIRVFENDLRLDGPVQRYKVNLILARARYAHGIMNEDRISLVQQAASIAESGIERFKDDKNMYSVYFETGVAYFRYSKSEEIFDRALRASKTAYERILDPELERVIRKYEGVQSRFSTS